MELLFCGCELFHLKLNSLDPHVQNFCHLVYSECKGLRTSLRRMNS